MIVRRKITIIQLSEEEGKEASPGFQAGIEEDKMQEPTEYNPLGRHKSPKGRNETRKCGRQSSWDLGQERMYNKIKREG